MLRIHLAFIAVIAVASAGSARAQEGLQGVIVESFDGRALGSHLELETAVGRLTSSDRNMRIVYITVGFAWFCTLACFGPNHRKQNPRQETR